MLQAPHAPRTWNGIARPAVLPLLLELLSNSIDVDIEVIGEKLADFGILVVSNQGLRVRGRGSVDVHVHGRMPVRAPSGLHAPRDDVREDVVQRRPGTSVADNRVDFGVRGIGHAEAGGEDLDDDEASQFRA